MSSAELPANISSLPIFLQAEELKKVFLPKTAPVAEAPVKAANLKNLEDKPIFAQAEELKKVFRPGGS
ncbi:hypothetical protein CERZMDRAFT_91367 [Cercospora zeae-maydis SCOH1-5]|uniref:Uncharacterized protein n=1 Tax=Cercospora zeae-maydis SCOH1-5 TaxID=717836 RepID=A0A6A6F8Q3_9PEZI|nr:hypothetical protein CERZMDRAFT_91367 [Cercospora zeae-maydis SCOH1-5]